MRRDPSVFRLAAAPIAAFAVTWIAAFWPIVSLAQVPLTPLKASGQTVTPVFEGWYPNPDGTYSLSFGYFNRNSEEVVDIPIGPDNFIQPGDANQGQPTSFHPRRHWGVFAVTVPADFGDRKVVWTLKLRGGTFAIPGSLHPDWQIDALEGEAGGNTPPVLKLDENGPEGWGPLGVAAGPLGATVGAPLTLSIWAADDGRAWGSIGSAGKQGVPVTLTYFKHQGPGQVTFSVPKDSVDYRGGKATVSATFSEPGAYILRVRANDASGVADAGHAQCCWTNGFVKVVVR
ncbi:MAG: hypothetical protein HYW06_04330 [Gemmatimonadetes bacterium]|nr:hypothetical protein [Gemmatimonadota bacterium]